MSRDRTVGETFYIAFTTRAFATGIPTVLAGTPVISAYEDAGLTQITAGLTLGVDHDSVVGLNMITIVATGGNGFEAGKDYQLVITTGTVGGVSVVGEVVGQFSLGLSAAFTAMRGTDNAALASVATEARLAELDAANIPADIDAIPTTAMRGTDSAALASVATEARLAELDGANLPADVAAIPTTAMRGTDGANTVVPDAAGTAATPADVLTQVNAAIDTAISELGVAVPSATPGMRQLLMLLYMALRNQLDLSAAGGKKIHNDAGSVIAKKALTDDGTTYSEAKSVAGP